MKKILFATTALVMTAGVASAEIAFSGKAGAGIGKTAASDATVWSGFDLDFTATTTTDSGITITFSEDIGGGSLADYDDDYAVEGQSNLAGTPKVTIGMGTTTLGLKDNGISDRYDDSQSGDIGIDAALGEFSVGLTVDTSPAANEPGFSYSASGTVSGIGLSVVGTDGNDAGDAAMKLAASYSIDALKLTLTSDNKGAADTVNEVAVAYSAGAMSVKLAADDADAWSLGFGYTEGVLSFNVGTDQGDAWKANMSYDLGGGASFKAAANAAEYVAAGVQFSF
jgi:outer membrane protein OmpU